MLTQDSISTVNGMHDASGEMMTDAPVAPEAVHVRHPFQVLRALPKDATPEQQDSAIQAAFQPREIHYSDMPDTLHLPGHTVGKSINDVSLPTYYNENYFKTDSLYHPELDAARYGEAGTTVNDTINNNDAITSLLIFCLLGTILLVSRFKHFFINQIKVLFSLTHMGKAKETTSELTVLAVICLQGILMLALVGFKMVHDNISDTFTTASEYVVMGIFLGEILGGAIFTSILQFVANVTFFSGAKARQWLVDKTLITALGVLLIMPAVFLYLYSGLEVINTLIYFVFAIIFVEIVSFYKAMSIFFDKNIVKLQIFLYFCTLEIIPLAVLMAILRATAFNLVVSI